MSEKTILCVDDEESILKSLRRLFRREPVRVLTASCGQEALELVAQHEIHLIISDFRMPGMTGTELLSVVSERSPETVRVVLSGYADAAAIVEAINRGHIFRFLAKPWNDDELRANVRACLDQQDLIVRHRKLTEELAQRNAELRTLTERQSALIEERTQTLRMAQEMIQALPLPVIGVSTDGTIALSNHEAELLHAGLVGRDIQEVLPANLSDAVRRSLSDPQNGREVARAHFSDDPFIAMVVPLIQGHSVRGSLVLLEASPCVI
ncbi:MAG: response regulator [Planctomycetaceae bacterium]